MNIASPSRQTGTEISAAAAALVDAEREVDRPAADRRARAAGGAACGARRIHGVPRRAEGARLAEPGGAEVVHVQLADDRAARGQDALDDDGVVSRRVT